MIGQLEGWGMVG